MGMVMRRSYVRRWPYFHPHTSSTPASWCPHRGAVVLGGPAGPVSRGDTTDLSYNGMDPSDPQSWVRPYNPQPGMCALFNFDPFLSGGEPARSPRNLPYGG
jgi:hypothetical protein